jgi:lysophospholipase L1-like esterase/MoaA/NifB/PqqE/SkfB family radical SAM enzyme
MENPCKIIFFGDSITKEYAPKMEGKLKKEYPDFNLSFINAGIVGETSRDGLNRLNSLLQEKPQVVVIDFGMNDWRKGVCEEEYKQNIIKIIDEFEKIGTRVILPTITPACEGGLNYALTKIENYNRTIKEEIYKEKRVKVIDLYSLWLKKFRNVKKGLRDKLHPNKKGYDLIIESLMYVIPRKNTTILWQYNGREAKCNGNCPYCYYKDQWARGDMHFGTIEQWHESFKKSFGNQHLIFYLAFGEPTLGKMFSEIVDMVEREENWELRMTSNVSTDFNFIKGRKIVKEGRLNINASFHPYSFSKEEFLKKILFLRENGIEPSVVYVAYPPLLERLESDIEFFAKYNFPVHIRRFQGWYKNKRYPWAYTDTQRKFIAKFMDDASIKYMLNQEESSGKLTYSGFNFFVIDNVGNIGYDSNLFPLYSKYRCIFGNAHQDNFKPLFYPDKYPKGYEGTVDGVANLVEANIKELEQNNVIHFSRQGGVYADHKGVHYKHLNTDFNNSKIRAGYNFPSRNIKDFVYKLIYGKIHIISTIKQKNKNLIENWHKFRNLDNKTLFFKKWIKRKIKK